MCVSCLFLFFADLNLIQELKGKVSISLDAWTSSNNIAFLAIVAHYVTNEESMVCDLRYNDDKLYANYHERGAAD